MCEWFRICRQTRIIDNNKWIHSKWKSLLSTRKSLVAYLEQWKRNDSINGLLFDQEFSLTAALVVLRLKFSARNESGKMNYSIWRKSEVVAKFAECFTCDSPANPTANRFAILTTNISINCIENCTLHSMHAILIVPTAKGRETRRGRAWRLI